MEDYLFDGEYIDENVAEQIRKSKAEQAAAKTENASSVPAIADEDIWGDYPDIATLEKLKK